MNNPIYAELWQQARGLVVLKIIFDLGRPVQLRELVRASGGDHETVAKYCNILSTMGLLTRVSSHTGWSLTAQGFAFLAPREKLSTGAVDNSPQNPLKYAESGALINTTTTTIDSHKVVVGNVLSGKSAFFSENLGIFDEIGITMNDQTHFIADHVPPETIRAEWKKLTDKGKPWPGLLIKILCTLPKQKSKAEKEAERRRRYGAWDQERK